MTFLGQSIPTALSSHIESPDLRAGILESFLPAAFVLRVIYWYHPPDYWAYCAFSEAFNLAILRAFEQEGIQFSLPWRVAHTSVWSEKEPIDLRIIEQADGAHEIRLRHVVHALQAEALLAHTQYAVVIADLRLTGISGMEGLDIIDRSRHLWRSTRGVLLTGYGSPEIEAEARRRGADALLHKPLPLPELERVVAGLTGKAA